MCHFLWLSWTAICLMLNTYIWNQWGGRWPASQPFGIPTHEIYIMVFSVTSDHANIMKWAYFLTVHNRFNTSIRSFCYFCRSFIHPQNFQQFIPWQIHPRSPPLFTSWLDICTFIFAYSGDGCKLSFFFFFFWRMQTFKRLGKKIFLELKSLLITRKSEAMPNQIPLAFTFRISPNS